MLDLTSYWDDNTIIEAIIKTEFRLPQVPYLKIPGICGLDKIVLAGYRYILNR